MAGGRGLRDLLFVTSVDRLAANVGVSQAQRVQAMIAAANQGWLDLGANARSVDAARAQVRQALQQKAYAGVVLIGGYDVVPPERLDVLDGTLRAEVERVVLKSGGRGDSDNFIVWNDDCYGDRDGDRLPELPVSRIPDGRNADLLFAQLGCAAGSVRLTTGVRNVDRPFAEPVFTTHALGSGKLYVSEPVTPGDLDTKSLIGSQYFMLHGRDTDTTRYWGEDELGEVVEAVNLTNVTESLAGCVVLLGCCWGALTALPRASKYHPNDAFQPKTDQDSLALMFLRNGATAVVGCTGTHYSPGEEPFTYFGQPMQMSFWEAIRRGLAPSEAIFEAKREFAANLPHGQFDVVSRAVELKICRQFTCLGLGW